jgi:glycosyltransferase involved in cell wall biosynthesis
MTLQLSIIIPCYNYAHYLEAAVDSVLQQDYPHYELLLIDDGSSDHSWEIMQNYGARFPQIRIFRNPKNLGIFKSNQRGWSEARGTYLHFFSADDLYQPTCLSKAISLFERNPQLGLVCTDLCYMNEEAHATTIKKLLPNASEPQIFNPKEMISLFQRTDFWIPGLTCIIKNEILKRHGHLDPLLENISDWYCFHKIALFEGVGYIPETLIAMRLHDQTYTSRVKRDKKRRRATYTHLLHLLTKNPEIAKPFKQSGLLSFIFKELRWRLRLNPRYLSYWKYIKK